MMMLSEGCVVEERIKRRGCTGREGEVTLDERMRKKKVKRVRREEGRGGKKGHGRAD